MTAEDLPEKIRLLVDHLRTQEDERFTLADVASVTEILISAMRSYFRGIDTQIYRECRTLADYIDNARREIASLEPDDLESAKIPRAGMELDAIVQHTETATNTIMECAEAIMNADPSDEEAYKATVQDNIVQIFEACSFQDITGQRISKVVETLSYVESRINELRTLLGITNTDIAASRTDRDDAEDDANGEGEATSGPALQGEGIDQSAVDAMFDGAAGAEPAEDAEAAAEEADLADDGDEEDAPAESGNDDASARPKPTRQDEIDALFG